MSTEEIRDWRGTLIEPGQTIVYGGPVGRSIQQVEGEVVGFTKSGRVRVKVIRRSYTVGEKDVVDVGHDRLTVVTELPATNRLTQAEELAVAETRRVNRASHDLEPYWLPRVENPDGSYVPSVPNPAFGEPCRACGRPAIYATDSPCPQERRP